MNLVEDVLQTGIQQKLMRCHRTKQFGVFVCVCVRACVDSCKPEVRREVSGAEHLEFGAYPDSYTAVYAKPKL